MWPDVDIKSNPISSKKYAKSSNRSNSFQNSPTSCQIFCLRLNANLLPSFPAAKIVPAMKTLTWTKRLPDSKMNNDFGVARRPPSRPKCLTSFYIKFWLNCKKDMLPIWEYSLTSLAEVSMFGWPPLGSTLTDLQILVSVIRPFSRVEVVPNASLGLG